ncbi:MAG: 50S ribosomal protein L29 [Candidatus Kappaea frigidicola]|nr:50S ribosomal protein L29 [Candidatus Kappaea frigidicola]
MKPEKAKDLIELTQDELVVKLQKFREELHKLRFDSKSGRVEKPDQIGITKKNIARILTVLREKTNAN